MGTFASVVLYAPVFFVLYSIGIIFALMTGGFLQRLVERRVVRDQGDLGLSVYQIAFLVDGLKRVVRVAFVRLIRRGVLKGGEAEMITRSDETASRLDPVETIILAVSEERYFAQAILNRTAMHLFNERAARQEIEAPLNRQGLTTATFSPRWWARYLAFLLPFAALIAAGLWRIGVEQSPGTFMRGIAIETVILVLCLVFLGRPSRQTAAGTRYLDGLRQVRAGLATAARTRGEDMSEADLALAVALFGSAALKGSRWAWIDAVFEQRVRST